MIVVAYILLALATLAASFDAKLLIVDVAWADYRLYKNRAARISLAISTTIALGFVALPVLLGGVHFAWHGHSGWAIVVALGSLLLSAFAFVGLAGAFKP
jgi:hypothetical protein